MRARSSSRPREPARQRALKYAKDGGRVAVAVEAEGGGGGRLAALTRQARQVTIRVSDRGPGIDPDEQKHIFERFARGRRASERQVRGSGIGLALVKHIAESHGGAVRVESPLTDDGRGSAFVVSLPALEHDRGGASGRRERRAGRGRSGAGRGVAVRARGSGEAALAERRRGQGGASAADGRRASRRRPGGRTPRSRRRPGRARSAARGAAVKAALDGVRAGAPSRSAARETRSPSSIATRTRPIRSSWRSSPRRSPSAT